ncbi:hypothetical protein [Nocardia sp. NPDC047654]|uniref:hypothetical protein n=1 Tax=Nocardia sp. NPDC047654 TaxID=3364314 RepID=UPI003712B280
MMTPEWPLQRRRATVVVRRRLFSDHSWAITAIQFAVFESSIRNFSLANAMLVGQPRIVAYYVPLTC